MSKYNIDDIDVLISESQFKTYKYYSSWEEYQSYAEKQLQCEKPPENGRISERKHT